jgi:uncharacterized protein YukE
MAQTKVTADLLSNFAQTLRDESARFQQIKASMDRELSNIHWEDPIAAKFRGDYYERLRPIERDLLPKMNDYQQHLDKEANIIREYLQG